MLCNLFFIKVIYLGTYLYPIPIKNVITVMKLIDLNSNSLIVMYIIHWS